MPRAVLLAVVVVLCFAPARARADVDLRIPFDVSGAHDAFLIGLGGLGLDVGEQVSPTTYLGVTAEYEAVLDAGAEDPAVTPDLLHRLRAGAEARFALADGDIELTSGGCACGCPPTSTPTHRRLWFGGAAGVETIDRGRTVGRFATITLAIDFRAPAGGTRFGIYASAEWARERSRSYPSVAAGDWDPQAVLTTGSPTTNVPTADATTDTLGLAFGLRVGW